jgi:hypothetical protein
VLSLCGIGCATAFHCNYTPFTFTPLSRLPAALNAADAMQQPVLMNNSGLIALRREVQLPGIDSFRLLSLRGREIGGAVQQRVLARRKHNHAKLTTSTGRPQGRIGNLRRRLFKRRGNQQQPHRKNRFYSLLHPSNAKEVCRLEAQLTSVMAWLDLPDLPMLKKKHFERKRASLVRSIAARRAQLSEGQKLNCDRLNANSPNMDPLDEDRYYAEQLREYRATHPENNSAGGAIDWTDPAIYLAPSWRE